MEAGEERTLEVAGAILDRRPIDWAAVRAQMPESRLLVPLRVVAALAEIHQRHQHPLPPATTEHALDAAGAPAVRLPAQWGHLQVLEPIGRGAFGEVYRAWDTRLDRQVALKLLPATRDDADARASSVIAEGRLLARVRHPHVVTIYGADRIAGRTGLWMELVEGRMLEEHRRTARR